MKHKLLRSLNVSLILSFMLFGMNLSAPKVFSAPVDTLGITDQGISTGETAENLLNSVTSTISAVAIDSTNHLGYFGSSAVPTTIYKVNIDPQSASYMHVKDKI